MYCVRPSHWLPVTFMFGYLNEACKIRLENWSIKREGERGETERQKDKKNVLRDISVWKFR